MPASESEMKLDLSPRWITVRRRNRQLTVRFISCAFVSPKPRSFPRRNTAPTEKEERKTEKGKQRKKKGAS